MLFRLQSAKGWYKGEDKDFSFSDVYAPVDFGAARFCDARVWAGFNKVADGMEKYADYAKGIVQSWRHKQLRNQPNAIVD
jgi:hypothetical protein